MYAILCKCHFELKLPLIFSIYKRNKHMIKCILLNCIYGYFQNKTYQCEDLHSNTKEKKINTELSVGSEMKKIASVK